MKDSRSNVGEKVTNQKKALKRGVVLVFSVFALALLLTSCSVPRYGDGYGHHMLTSNSGGGHYDVAR